MTDQSQPEDLPVSVPPEDMHLDDQLAVLANGRHPGVVGLVRFFRFSHLPANLQPKSAACSALVVTMLRELEDGPELTAGLRKLLEAKDCFVRAGLDGG